MCVCVCVCVCVCERERERENIQFLPILVTKISYRNGNILFIFSGYGVNEAYLRQSLADTFGTGTDNKDDQVSVKESNVTLV